MVALFTALLFVTHPITTESVSNIIGRSDIMAAISIFAGLLLYIKSTEIRGGNAGRGCTAMMVVMALGLFSKESAIALVGIVAAYDAVYRWTLDDLRRAIPSFLIFSGIAALLSALGLVVGRFEALGLSEGLRPALIIFLVLSLLGCAGFSYAWMRWTSGRPRSTEGCTNRGKNSFYPT